MPTYTVSLTRIIHEDAVLLVKAENEEDARTKALHEVSLGTVDFTRAHGACEVTLDWMTENQ